MHYLEGALSASQVGLTSTVSLAKQTRLVDCIKQKSEVFSSEPYTITLQLAEQVYVANKVDLCK